MIERWLIVYPLQQKCYSQDCGCGCKQDVIMGKVKLIVPEYYAVARISAAELAKWLGEHAMQWWTADGEAHLMETLSFPCPGNELADAISKLGDQQAEIMQDRQTPVEIAEISASDFESYANTENRNDARNFLLRWQGAKRLWLLSEDVPASESSSSSSEAELDSEDSND
jgi:hypothetical protein